MLLGTRNAGTPPTPSGLACGVGFLAAFVLIFVGVPALLNMLRRNEVWAELEARGFLVLRRLTPRDEALLARMVGPLPDPWPAHHWRVPRHQRTRLVWIAVSGDVLIVEHRFHANKRVPVYITSVTTLDGVQPGTLASLFTPRALDGQGDMSEALDLARELGTHAQTTSHKEKMVLGSVDRLLNH